MAATGVANTQREHSAIRALLTTYSTCESNILGSLHQNDVELSKLEL